jgi:hypothetical protein
MSRNGNRPRRGAAHSVGIGNAAEPSQQPTPTQAEIAGSNSLAEHEARISQLAGVTDNESDKRRRRAIRNAARSCSNCAKCGCTLTPEAPVWRQSLSLGPIPSLEDGDTRSLRFASNVDRARGHIEGRGRVRIAAASSIKNTTVAVIAGHFAARRVSVPSA